MANQPAGSYKRPTEIKTERGQNGNNYKEITLKEFLDKELKGEQKNAEAINQLKQTFEAKRLEKAHNDSVAQAKALAKLEDELSVKGLELTNELKKKFLTEFQNEQIKANDELILDYYKKIGKESVKQQNKDKKRREDDINAYKKIAELRASAESKKEDGDTAGAIKDTIKADLRANGQMLKESFREVGDNLGKNLVKLGGQLSNAVNNAISTYANYQLGINTRLQSFSGAVDKFSNIEDTLEKVSMSPLIRTEDLYSNLSELVAEGISANVEQRAFLQTVKDGIATTFDANNSSLKRIIRLQQDDSTAARLGMEAYLTSYLNELTKNTEYLQNTFDSVSDSLLEASSLLTSKESTEFEYVVQKWLGTFTGLGLSEATAQAIGEAIGQLGSGNINALSNNQGMENLLVMAAARKGGDFSQLLTNGLTANDTNNLMRGIFEYLAEIGANESNVVKSQYAQTFGVNVSDLVAARNILDNNNETINNLYSNLLTYSDMYGVLTDQMGDVVERMGNAKLIENLFDNFSFSQGANIAGSKVGNITWKITDMIQQATGGINIPYITAMGTGVDLEATVEGLMKLGIVGVSTLGSIGGLINGLNSIGDGASLLGKLGIAEGTSAITRGNGSAKGRASGVTTSFSSYMGNSSGSDYYQSSISGAEDESQSKVEQANQEENSVDRIEKHTIKMDALLEDTKDEIVKMNNRLESGIKVSMMYETIEGGFN